MNRVAALALNAKPSVDFSGSWPRHKSAQAKQDRDSQA
jgi:hypothetical protein